jgi:hypothetical protein
MSKVKIINMVDHVVHVGSDELRFNRTWPRKDAVVTVDSDLLNELMYDPGFEYMIRTGILYIEDMDVKKELGLEPEDAIEPENIIVLNDAQRKDLMIKVPLTEFEEKVNKLGKEQQKALVDYAIEHRYGDFEKSKILKNLTGRDVVKAIQLAMQNEEEIDLD